MWNFIKHTENLRVPVKKTTKQIKGKKKEDKCCSAQSQGVQLHSPGANDENGSGGKVVCPQQPQRVNNPQPYHALDAWTRPAVEKSWMEYRRGLIGSIMPKFAKDGLEGEVYSSSRHFSLSLSLLRSQFLVTHNVRWGRSCSADCWDRGNQSRARILHLCKFTGICASIFCYEVLESKWIKKTRNFYHHISKEKFCARIISKWMHRFGYRYRYRLDNLKIYRSSYRR